MNKVAGFLCLAVVVLAGVIGSILSDERSAEILAFTLAVAVSLMGLLQAAKAAQVGRETQRYVNSHYGNQLNISATALRALASKTLDPVDIKAAEFAERLYAEHMTVEADVKS